MKSIKKTRVYLMFQGETYHVISLDIKNDNSVYIYLPSKNGLRVSCLKEVPYSKGEMKIRVKNNKKLKMFNPYISYHPGKGTIHSNAENSIGKKVLLFTDRRTVKLNELLEKKNCHPVVSIIMSLNLDVLAKQASPRKDSINLSFKNDTGSKNTLMYFEVFVLSREGYMTKDSLMFQEKRNVLGVYNCEYNDAAKIYYAVVANAVNNEGGAMVKEIRMFCWGKEDPMLISMRRRLT